MQKTRLILCFILLIGSSLAPAKAQKCVMTEEKIQQSLQQQAERLLTDKRFHSVSIGLYFQGKTYSLHHGELTIGQGNPPNDHTLYEIASVSKTMIGLVTAKAVLEGKLDLDTDINHYLSKPLLNLSPKSNPMTIRQLVTHHSGLPHNLSELAPYLKTETASPGTFLQALNHPDLDRTPGQFSYSNLAPELLAHLLETVYEQPFEKLLKDTLQRQAGMRNTSITLDESQESLLTLGYNEQGEQMPALIDPPALWGASGQVKSTLPDLMQYLKLQLDKQNPLIQESQKRLSPTDSVHALGYFWSIGSNQDGPYYQHHGGLYGTQNWMFIYPQYDIGLSVISNVSFAGVGNSLEDVADRLVDEIKQSGVKSIRLAIQDQCIDEVNQCIERYQQLKKTQKSSYAFGDENELNTLGYYLLSLNKIQEAIAVLKLQVEEFPSKPNPYDSLAEAYYIQKDYARSLVNYKKSYVLDPANTNAKTMINKINDITDMP